MIERSYLNKIKVETMQFSKICCKLILLEYSICLPWHKYSNHMHDVTINQLFIKNYIACDTSSYTATALLIKLDTTMYNVNTLLSNSKFHNMNQPALMIKNSYSLSTSHILSLTVHLN